MAQPDDADRHRNGGNNGPTHLNGHSHDEVAAKPAYRFSGKIPPALEHLHDRPQWVAWAYRRKGDRWTKLPIDPRTGRNASVSDARTWATFDVALAGMERHRLDGVGLVLTGEDELAGVDLDDCISDSGSLSALAAEIVGYGETYAETSPSGAGIRIFARGKIDKALKDDKEGVEVYGIGRYLTITGNQIEGTPSEIKPAPRTLAKLRTVVEVGRAASSRPNGNGKPHATGSDFFANVSAAALARLDDWVPALHPTARKQPNGAWRVTSKDLGRDLEEDLAYHPGGIRDHGEEHGLSAINAVLRFGDTKNAKAAGLWLCQRMGIEPTAMGWTNNGDRGEPQPRLIALMDQGLTDDEVRVAIGRDDMDDEIAKARMKWEGEARRQRAHAKTAEKPPQTNAPTDGAVVLDMVFDFIGRFVAYPSEHDQVAHTLWTAHTHAMDAWDSTPRLAFLSEEPASGKTRALEVSEPLVPRPVEAVNVSPAYLFRKVASDEGRPTILFDEIDTVFGPKAKENEEIRGLLNAGHRKSGVAGRCVVYRNQVKTEEIPA